MTFVQIEKRNGMINLDGYSRNKTLKGALKDLAREVAKIDEGEGNAITDNIDEYMGMVVDGMLNEVGCFYIEAEEVHCASRYSERNDEMEYAEGHWYLYIRFCAPEQESKEPETSTTEQVAETEAIVGADAEAVSAQSEEVQEEETMRYEIKRTEVDPFDIMCGDCPEHEIEWWEPATLEELHEVHAEELADDTAIPDWARDEMLAEGWRPTTPSFDEWLKQSITDGYVRLAA